jgi:hypothetical protein
LISWLRFFLSIYFLSLFSTIAAETNWEFPHKTIIPWNNMMKTIFLSQKTRAFVEEKKERDSKEKL